MTRTGYEIMKLRTTAALKAAISEAPNAIELPWPPSELSPNGRHHWAVKSAAFSAYKTQCGLILSAAKNANGFPIAGANNFSLTFCPPDKRKHDLDNCLGRFKAGIDAISTISRVDDSDFKLSIQKGEPVKGGAVLVEII